MRSSSLQMSLADVAAVAHVQRPVVSVWRARSSRSPVPFPDPVATVRGEDRFDLDDVIDWLETTGRGNNDDVRGDAAAFALPKGMTAGDDAQVFDGLTALLCLRAITGEPLAGDDRRRLLATAEEADPDDLLLVHELEALGPRLVPLARFADQATDAAYGTAPALEKLMDARFRLALRGHAAVHLAPPAHDLVASLAVALAREIGMDPGVYVDPTTGGDLLVSLMSRDEDTMAATVRTPDDDSPASRLTRRRLRVHDVHRAPLHLETDGGFAVPGQAVHVASFPSPARPGLDRAHLLTTVDNIQLQMSDEQRAVILAPASALADRIADRRVDQQRDHLLRLGRIRAVVRLPRGLVTASPRQSLALWVLGPEHAHVRADDKWTAVADLTDVALDPAAIGDLVSDVVAAMGDQAAVRGHAFRFARLTPTARLLAGRGALIPARTAASRPERTSPAELALRIQTLRDALDAPATDPLAGSDVTVRQDAGPPDRMPLGAALQRRLVRLVPGNRLQTADVGHDGDGTVPVLGVDELVAGAPVGRRGIDRLLLTARYDAARLTRPEDVIFCTSPRPAAMVDHDGGSVVAYPARVLRVTAHGAGLVPAVVADDINTQPARSRTWRGWSLQRVPTDQTAGLDATLEQLAGHQAQAAARVDQLAELRRLLVHGIAGQSLNLDPPTNPHPDPQASPMEGS